MTADPAGGPAAGERRPVWALWALSLSMFVVGTASLIVLGVGHRITSDFAVSDGAAGWLMTLFALVFAVTAPLAQWGLQRRWTRRRILQTGLLLLAAGLFWAAWAESFVSLLASRGLAAVGGALVGPTSAALAVSLVSEARRGRALATVFAGFTLASVAGVPLGTWLGLTVGWRGAMAVVGGLALFALAGVVIAVGRAGARAAVGPGAIAAGATPWRALAAVLTTTAGVLAAQFAVYAVMAAYLVQGFGLAAALLPLAMLAFGVAGVAGNAAAGWLADRLGPARVTGASLAGLALMFGLLIVAPGPVWAAAVLAGCAFMGTLFTAPQQARLTFLVPAHRHALVLAFNVSASYAGIAIGSVTASAVYDGFGAGALPLGALGLLALAAAADLLARRVR